LKDERKVLLKLRFAYERIVRLPKVQLLTD